MPKQLPHFPLLPTIVTLLVAAAVITGLVLAGSPSEERFRRYDQERISDLQQIQSSVIETYDTQYGHLPQTLEEAMKRSPVSPEFFVDPETKQPYSYSVLSSESYQLCATFSLPSSAQTDPVSAMWEHPAGSACFTLQIPLNPINPTKAIPSAIPTRNSEIIP
jgi:hypothetical protein